VYTHKSFIENPLQQEKLEKQERQEKQEKRRQRLPSKV